MEGEHNANADVVVYGHAEPRGFGVINSYGAKDSRSHSCVQPADGEVMFNLSPSLTQAEPNGPKFSHERISISGGQRMD
jgi:hypothetical protein